MNTLILLTVLWVGPADHYKSPKSFLAAHRISLKELCTAYDATNCVVKEEMGESIEGTGFQIEDNTAKWSLYGKKVKK
jgi:hypothetical protein